MTTTTIIPAGFHVLPLPSTQLSLYTVLKCGQSFRWTSYPISSVCDSSDTPPAYEYRFCLRDRVVCLRQSSEALFYRSVFPNEFLDQVTAAVREQETLSWLRDYFQLDVDLAKLYDEWSERDPVFRNIRSRFLGIRMLRQDPWENLVSFICSSNNNIARITKMVQALCTHYSPPLLSLGSLDSDATAASVMYHPFPPPSALASPEVATKLRSLGFGYRADFIQRTARMLIDEHGTAMANSNPPCATEAAEKWLMTLRSMDTPKAREALLRFVGVGRKVADCILLMSLDKREVIPVDTHVCQIAAKHYGFHFPGGAKKVSMTPKTYDAINNKLAGTWGEYAGWAHTVLFTSDLKEFSSYGTSASPSTSVVLTPSRLTPTVTPMSGSKRTRKVSPVAHELPVAVHHPQGDVNRPTDDTSLAERVKKRRRGAK